MLRKTQIQRVAALPGSEDEAQRRQGRLECERICDTTSWVEFTRLEVGRHRQLLPGEVGCSSLQSPNASPSRPWCWLRATERGVDHAARAAVHELTADLRRHPEQLAAPDVLLALEPNSDVPLSTR